MSDLLDRTIEAHGGLERWRGVRAIDVVFNFSGGLLDLKGFPGHHRPAVSVDTLKPRAVLQRLSGDPDDRWIFTADRVWIERRDGEIVQERFQPRAAFAGHDRNTPWDRLHLTYFLGYAIWNYLTVPFLLAGPGFATYELEKTTVEVSRVPHAFLCMHVDVTTPAETIDFVGSYSSIVSSFPRKRSGSASAFSVSRLARRSLTLQPTCSPSRLNGPLHRRLRQLCYLRRRFDCYRAERTSSRVGLPPTGKHRLSRRTRFSGVIRSLARKPLDMSSLEP